MGKLKNKEIERKFLVKKLPRDYKRHPKVYQFVELAPAVENWIKKVRFFLPLGAHMAELDVFYGSLGGLIMAEVEFDSIEECDAFVPPKWFGREVTDDKRYTNHSLALHGLPED